MAFRSCSSFEIRVTDVSGSIARARTAIIENGGTIDGDDERGKFEGTTVVGEILGTYTTTADAVLVTITRKPWPVLCGRIEAEVRRFFR